MVVLLGCRRLGTSYGTPNYHVQALFAQSRGDVVLPVKLEVGEAPPVVASGGIGLGTYRTAAEFKDVHVSRETGTLFDGDLSQLRLPREGDWTVKDGALAQTDARAIATAAAGDNQWSDYTLTLKARKTSGLEGFLIVVRNDGANTRVQWNVGGWGNTKHGIQSWLGVQEQIVGQVPGRIEKGHWYDVKIELKGAQMNCYLDGQLVQSAQIPVPRTGGFFASAVRDEQAGEVVVKVVNATPESREVAVELAGVKSVKAGARGILLTGERLSDLNDFATPNRVAPRAFPVSIRAPKFSQTVPPNSLVVLRVPAE